MKKILVIRFSALGDVAMLAPVLREIITRRDDIEFTILSKPFCRPLFEGISERVTFLGIDPKKEYKGITGLYRLFRKLHSMHFDAVCDTHDVLRTKVLRLFFRLHGYRVEKINKHRTLRKLITAQGNKKQLRQLPTSFDNYRAAISATLPQTTNHTNKPQPSTHKPQTSTHKPQTSTHKPQTSTTQPTTHKPLKIGIAPFAAHKGKIYPLEKMAEVIKLLVQESAERQIFLFGGGGKERELMAAWAAKYDTVQLASDTCKSLADELSLMKDLDVMISMDSANMHLASLVGTRVVSIWGATHPYAGFLGWGQRITDCVQREDLPCRPCSIYGNKPCLHSDMRCMDITPEEIVKRTREQEGKRGQRK